MTDDVGASPARPPRLLVISTQGLKRFVPALGAMGAIRAHHRDAHIVLLTHRTTSAFAGTAPYFDEIWVDPTDGVLRGIGDLRRAWALRAQLTADSFDCVYDLDGTAHTARLFWLMHGRRALPLNREAIAWSGVIPGTALSYDDPRQRAMHLVDRWAAQLKIAGIGAVLRPDMSWVARHVQSFTVPFRMTAPFVMIAAAPGPGQPWSPERTGELARVLAGEGQIPVLMGPDVPPDVWPAVAEACPSAVDLTGRATVNEMVFLAWAATAAVGPDNGVMHLTAAAGCPTVVLYDNASDPALVGQRGNKVTLLRRPRLADIPVGEVAAAIRRMPAHR
jgi:ADP-heptose:LPS heptosyltransferase